LLEIDCFRLFQQRGRLHLEGFRVCYLWRIIDRSYPSDDFFALFDRGLPPVHDQFTSFVVVNMPLNACPNPRNAISDPGKDYRQRWLARRDPVTKAFLMKVFPIHELDRKGNFTQSQY